MQIAEKNRKEHRKIVDKITEEELGNIPTPAKGQPAILVKDDGLKGFYARLSPRGTSYHLQVDHGGQTIHVNLSKEFGVDKPKDARPVALREVGRIQNGERAPKPEHTGLLTLRVARDQYLEHLREKGRRPRTFDDFEGRFDPVFDGVVHWMDRPLLEIESHEVKALHRLLSRPKAPGKPPRKAKADGVIRSLRAVINLALETYSSAKSIQRVLGGSFGNPCKQRSLLHGRKVHTPQWGLSDYGSIWSAMDELVNLSHQRYFKVLALTGMRPGQCRLMRLEHLRLDAEIPHIAMSRDETKTSVPYLLPVGTELRAVLERQRETVKEGDWLFPTYSTKATGMTVPLNSPVTKPFKKRFKGFRPNDFRHLIGEVAKRCGLDGVDRARILHHVGGYLTDSTYLRTNLESLAAPMQRIEDEILRLAGVAKSL